MPRSRAAAAAAGQSVGWSGGRAMSTGCRVAISR